MSKIIYENDIITVTRCGDSYELEASYRNGLMSAEDLTWFIEILAADINENTSGCVKS